METDINETAGRPREKYELVEQSLIKKFRRPIWLKFLAAVRDYRLIQPGDRIAVCISGGKDSTLMAKCMQQLHRYSKFPFDVEYLVMDPGYHAENRRLIEENCALLHIPATFFETRIYDIVAKTDRSPCYLCAKMRRGWLYRRAGELGCNKIALGHHFDDAIETVLLSMLYGSEIRTMLPKLHSTSHPGMELIRPLYMVREDDIIAWRRYNELNFIQCACRLTENCVLGDAGGTSKRQEVKQMLRRLRRNNPHVDASLFASMHNVCLDALPGYRQNGVRHSFLDHYDSCTGGQNGPMSPFSPDSGKNMTK